MKIKVKLFSDLMEYLPASADGNVVEIETQGPMSPRDVLAHFNIPEEKTRVMMCNGEFIPPEMRDDALNEGDSLTIWPSIQGG